MFVDPYEGRTPHPQYPPLKADIIYTGFPSAQQPTGFVLVPIVGNNPYGAPIQTLGPFVDSDLSQMNGFYTFILIPVTKTLEKDIFEMPT